MTKAIKLELQERQSKSVNSNKSKGVSGNVIAFSIFSCIVTVVVMLVKFDIVGLY